MKPHVALFALSILSTAIAQEHRPTEVELWQQKRIEQQRQNVKDHIAAKRAAEHRADADAKTQALQRRVDALERQVHVAQLDALGPVPSTPAPQALPVAPPPALMDPQARSTSQGFHIRDDGGVVAIVGGKVVNFASVQDAIKAGVIPRPLPLITPEAPAPESTPSKPAPAAPQKAETPAPRK